MNRRPLPLERNTEPVQLYAPLSEVLDLPLEVPRAQLAARMAAVGELWEPTRTETVDLLVEAALYVDWQIPGTYGGAWDDGEFQHYWLAPLWERERSETRLSDLSLAISAVDLGLGLRPAPDQGPQVDLSKPLWAMSANLEDALRKIFEELMRRLVLAGYLDPEPPAYPAAPG